MVCQPYHVLLRHALLQAFSHLLLHPPLHHQVIPHRGFYGGPTLPGGICWRSYAFRRTVQADSSDADPRRTNFLTNVFVLLLPMPFVWTLNLSVRSRVALSFVFMMGGIACVMSLVRVILQGEWLVNFNSRFLLLIMCGHLLTSTQPWLVSAVCGL
jgi:hypothetical protein